jgi:Rad3-related DNA helicase
MTLRSIIQLAERIPNGMLVVTPSYKILNSLERCLQYNPDLKKRLTNGKKIFTESKDNFEGLIKTFRKAAVEKKGAILFCVCRGKIS